MTDFFTEWYMYADFPHLEKFNLPKIDKGVDLIRWDVQSNTVYLVQCKFRKEVNRSITYGKDKLSHVEAMGWRIPDGYQAKLIVMTTAKGCTGIDKDTVVHANLMKPFRLWQRYNFPLVDSCNDCNHNNSTSDCNQIKYRDYQDRIIQDCKKFLGGNNSGGMVIMPTGSGKTITFLGLLGQSKTRKIIVAPTLALLSQISDRIGKMYNLVPFNLSSDGSTDPDRIKTVEENWIVVTYASLSLLNSLPQVRSLIVLDEAHNVNADHISTLNKLPYPHKNLYFTATPSKLLRNMPVIAEYSLEQAIAEKYLVNYNVGLIIDSLYDPTLDPVSVIVSGIVHCVEHYNNRKIVLYCNSVATVKVYQDLLNAKFPGYVGVITGLDSSESRERTLNDFKIADVGILINIRILREGIDIPQIDTVVFSVEKHSTIDIMQCIGRALRRSDNKRYATVLVPYVTGATERIAKALRRISPDITGDRIFSVRTLCLTDIESYTVDPERIRIDWIRDDRDWSEKYDKLLAYVAEYNDLPMHDTVYQDILLGKWCSTQRTFYTKGKIKQSRVEKLEQIKLWKWNVDPTVIFQQNFDLLVEYVREHKNMPSQTVIYKDKRIGGWINDVRNKLYKTGRLSQEWIDKFNAIPGWYFSRDDRTDLKLALVAEYVAEYGKIPSQKTVYKDVRIGEYINTQRALYKKNMLDENIKNILQTLPGWYWKKDYDADFYKNAELLEKYIAEHDCFPARDVVINGVNIGKWINVVRREYNNNNLSKDRILYCEQIKYWHWDYQIGLKDLKLWIREYRKPKTRNSGQFRKFNKNNTKPMYIQKVLTSIHYTPTEEEALAVIEKTDLSFTTKQQIAENKKFFEIWAIYQGGLFSQEFTKRLTKIFSVNPLLDWI